MYHQVKSMVAGCVAVAIGFVFPSTTYHSPGTMLSVLSRSNSPDKVCKMVSSFKYETDTNKEPSIKPSYVFLSEKKGDCKDFSFFAYECGKYNNINCRYYLMFDGTGRGHASCIWKIDNKYYPICNVTCINKTTIKGYTNISGINEMYLAAFKWKKIDYSYYSIPYQYFWKPEKPMEPSNPKAEDF